MLILLCRFSFLPHYLILLNATHQLVLDLDNPSFLPSFILSLHSTSHDANLCKDAQRKDYYLGRGRKQYPPGCKRENLYKGVVPRERTKVTFTKHHRSYLNVMLFLHLVSALLLYFFIDLSTTESNSIYLKAL